MEKLTVLKILLITVVCIVITLFTTSVKAVEDGNFPDILNEASNENTNANANTNSNNNSNTNTNSNSNSNVNTNSNSNTNRNTNLNTNTRNNTSNTYNNSNLPNTGIQNSIPTVLLLIVFVISAVYAYKKIKEYKNI